MVDDLLRNVGKGYPHVFKAGERGVEMKVFKI